MTRIIEIEGSVIRQVERNVLSEAPLADLAPFLTTRLASTFPILPRNTKYITYNPELKNGMLAVEMQPKRIHIKLLGRRYHIQLPYQYFVYGFSLTPTLFMGVETLGNFTITSSYLYWRPTPYTSAEDKLWVALIPNVGRSGDICWGNTHAETASLNQRIDDLSNNFETTEFNGDLGLNTPYEYNHDFPAWQTASDDPLVYTKWNMWTDDSGTTMQEHFLALGNPTIPAPATFDPSFVDMPDIPTNFTVGRAVEWLNALSDPRRRRWLTAISLMRVPDADEAPAPNPEPNILIGVIEEPNEAAISLEAIAEHLQSQRMRSTAHE